MTELREPPLLRDEEMDKVKFDMGAPWGLTDRYTIGRAIAQAQLDICVSDEEEEKPRFSMGTGGDS